MSDNPQGSLTLAAHVRRYVLDAIASGELTPGMAVDEQALCKRFETSRTPVREAMLQLAAEGFVSSSARGGATVPRLTIARLREQLELLAELEAAAAKYATRRMSRTQLDGLRALFQQSEAVAQGARDPKAYEQANERFHDAIYSAACNDALVQQIRGIRLRCASYTLDQFEFPGRIQKSVEEHRRLLEAIESGEPDRAHAAMLEHIGIGGRDFSEFVSRLPVAYIAS